LHEIFSIVTSVLNDHCCYLLFFAFYLHFFITCLCYMNCSVKEHGSVGCLLFEIVSVQTFLHRVWTWNNCVCGQHQSVSWWLVSVMTMLNSERI
jgi:hypothetical protein